MLTQVALFEFWNIVTRAGLKPTLTEHFIRYLLDVLVFCCCSQSTWRFDILYVQDALLHTAVNVCVMCGYLRYCHLPVNFDLSGPSPLTTLKHISTRRTAAQWTFLEFAENGAKKLEIVVCENPGDPQYVLFATYTVGAIIIWSLADFVGLPPYKEWNCV